MAHDGLTTGKAAKYIGRHPKTLQALDRRGDLPAQRTKTGKRYWYRADLDAYLGRTAISKPRRRIAYCRVSSQAQRPDLKNQRSILEQFCIAAGLSNVDFVEEIGGGLNLKRPKFLVVVDAICAHEVEALIVAHRDRLCRFGFDLLAHLCVTHGCALHVIDTEQVSPEQEMVQDLMTITHCFSARLYGLRNYRKALAAAVGADRAT